MPGRTRRALGRALSMEQLSQQSGEDAPAAALLEDILELALWTVNVAIVLDPERVVIGGGFLRSPSDLASRARQAFAELQCFAQRSNRPISELIPPW